MKLLAALALTASALAGCGGSTDAQAAPTRTVILVSLDTLRPERLGVYGNAADVSPAIDALAREATVFDQALATAPWTLPSHMSLLTGLDPVAHGVRTANDKLSSKVETVAEQLRAAGFRTAAFTDGGFVGAQWGFEQGFDVYDAERAPDRNGLVRTLPKALDWLRAQGDAPAFLFLHTFDTHAPYSDGDSQIVQAFRQRPTPDGDDDFRLYRSSFTKLACEMGLDAYGRLSEVLNDYDSGVHEADRGVGRLVEELKRLGRWDDALVVVLSDHGEAFYEHDFWIGHGLRLKDNELRVPLLVKFPRGEAAGRRDGRLVDLVDVASTLVECAGVRPAAPMQGSSLRELMRGGERSRSYVFGDTANTERYFLVRDGYKYITPIGIEPMMVFRAHLRPFTPPAMMAFAPGWALTYPRPDGTVEELYYDDNRDVLGLRDGLSPEAQLYSRADDPGELHDLAAEQPERLRAMQAALLSVYAHSAQIERELEDGATRREVTGNELAQLQQLGYLGVSAEGGREAAPPGAAAPIFQPFAAPDVSALDATDRVVHSARLAARAGSAAPAGFDVAKVQALADAYLRWAEQHPEFKSRVVWRIAELGALARKFGIEARLGRWIGRVQRLEPGAAASDGAAGSRPPGVEENDAPRR